MNYKELKKLLENKEYSQIKKEIILYNNQTYKILKINNKKNEIYDLILQSENEISPIIIHFLGSINELITMLELSN